ncbi:MAG: hypothetical protein EOO91_08155 [Pedobacter sp.]|nr:MAG: hypothetical protein EOO91_08155 [Pedobacter sp.]
MKKTLLTFLFISSYFIVNAQKSDSTHTHYAFYRGFSTHETELISKKGILNGEYIIFNGRKKTGVLGNYKNDERVGRWICYTQKDSIDQIYNYTTKTLIFNKPDKRITYYIDSLKDGDKVIYPAKIMGYFGLFLLTRNYVPPVESVNYNKVEEVNLKKLKPEDFEFSPAKVNGKNVECVMVFEGSLAVNLNH